MIVTTTDPVTGKEVFNPESHPFLIEGQGEYAIKIYFESEASKRAYQEYDDEYTVDGFFSD